MNIKKSYEIPSGKKSIGLKVKAGAKFNSIDGELEIDGKTYLKIQIKSPPQDGKANEEIISFLSQQWNIPKSQLQISSGYRSKIKILTIL